MKDIFLSVMRSQLILGTNVFRYIFVKILLLMTFIYISISLKTLNILENKSQVFERSDCTIT